MIDQCINTLSKNYTLLSLINSGSISPDSPKNKQNKEAKTFSFDLQPIQEQLENFEPNQLCPDHKQIVHSYVEKPFAFCCNECVKEYSKYQLSIKPIPNLIKYVGSLLESCDKALNCKKTRIKFLYELISRTRTYNNEDTAQKLKAHFQQIFQKINKAHQDKKQEIKQQLDQEKIQTEEKKLLDQIQYYEKIQLEIQNCENKYQSEEILGAEVFQPLQHIQEQLAQDDYKVQDIQKVTLHAQNKNLETLYSLIENSIKIKEIMHQQEIEKPELQQCQSVIEGWYCKCEHVNRETQIQCEKCSLFRDIESYPNLINDPHNANEQEIKELEQRRQIEKKLLNDKDNEDQGNSGLWYIISTFVQNKPKGQANVSPNQNIGVLPPGPISNFDLFTPNHDLKQGLKKVIHYRGVNQRVWEEYFKIYGGGPMIARYKLDIYSKPAQ